MILLEKLKYKTLSIYLYIPSLVTFTGCFFGLLSIFFSLTGEIYSLKIASSLIVMAGFMDKLDGYLARKLDAVSNFGKELDSLCDLVSFGLAPVIIWWIIDPNLQQGLSFLVPIFFVLSGIFRLARFNIDDSSDEYIVGLPITIAGIVLALKHFLDISLRLGLVKNITSENIVLVTLLSVLMLSKFKIKKFF